MTAGLLAILHKIVGGVLVLFGIVLLPMPIPFGLLLMVLGLALLAPYFVPIQRLVRSLRRKYPKVDDTMRRMKHRCPRVMKTTIEKTCPQTTSDDMPAA
ncbi:MAG: PGPGW domain-containing protein [Pseudomonadota bacterium]